MAQFDSLGGRLDPREVADRILNGIDTDDLDLDERLRFAELQLKLAQVDEDKNLVLIRLFELLEEEQDKKIVLAVLRRRVRILPPPPGVIDGLQPNGGR